LLLGQFVGVQVVVQALGFASGILLVRSLSKHDYALFTIANTIMGTMNVLADSGIGSGLTAIGGRVWSDPFRFGQLISTALSLRQVFGATVTGLGLPISAWLLIKNGATPLGAVGICLAITISLYFQISNGILTVIPRLLLQTNRLQQVDFASAIMRLLLIGLAWLLLLNVSTALWAATAAFGIQWLLLRRWTQSSISQNAPVAPEMRSEILAIVRKQAPNGLYYCLQGQIAVWLISICGSTTQVADFGALGRLSILFAVIGSVTGSLLIPRFARIQDPALLRRSYFQILTIFYALTAGFAALAQTTPELLLWVLGAKYTHLHHELFLIMINAGMTSLVGAMWSLNTCRGWYFSPVINIGSVILAQIIAMLLVDLSTVAGVISISLAGCIPELVLYPWLALRKSRQMPLAA